MCLALFAEFSITSDVVLSKWKKGIFPSSCMTMNVITKSAIFKTHFMHVPDPLMVAIHYASPKCKYNDRSAADERQTYNLPGVEWLRELQLDLFHGASKRKKEACRRGHLSALINKHLSDTGSVNNGSTVPDLIPALRRRSRKGANEDLSDMDDSLTLSGSTNQPSTQGPIDELYLL